MLKNVLRFIWRLIFTAWTAPHTWAVAERVTAALLNTHLRDNLSYLLTPNEFVVTAATGTFTTTSTSYTNVDATFSKTIVMNGGHLLVGMRGVMYNSANGNTMTLAVDVDGTQYVGVTNQYSSTSAVSYTDFTMLIPGLSAASHVVSLVWKTTAGTATMDKTYSPLEFWGVEI